jgi:serine/threonine protein kinase
MNNEKLQLRFGPSIRSHSKQYYRNIQALGEGKNASTYLTLITSPKNKGSLKVIKILNNPADKAKKQRFTSEISVLEGLDHSSIMRISDKGFYNDQTCEYPFYVCEYYNDTLSGALHRGRISLAQKVCWSIQLCSALANLAAKNIVHCDVKPDNIFVDGIKCVLGDFGLAYSVEEGLDPCLPSLHNYRSPDVVSALKNRTKIEPVSDVFLLGLTLTEMFTGNNPCQNAENGIDDVQLDENKKIPGEFGERINSILSSMLNMDGNKRITAEKCIDIWQGILFDVGEASSKIDGSYLVG